MNKQVIIGSAVVAALAIGGSSAYAVDQHNKEVAAQKAKVIKEQFAKLTNAVKNFSTKDLTQADQTITDIKGLKSLSADQIKTLTDQLTKDKKTVVDNLNKQKVEAEKKAAVAQEQAQQEATQEETQQGNANYDAGSLARNSQYTAPAQKAPASNGGSNQATSAPQSSGDIVLTPDGPNNQKWWSCI